MSGISGEEMSNWERMLDNGGGGGREKITVSVRLRPLSVKETTNSDSCEWECVNDTTILFKSSTPERPLLPTSYTFDRVFNCDSTTRSVYEEGAREVTLSVLSGINSSIFAYGQTSSGKTYTMSGITEYSMADIYDYIEKNQERTFVMKFSAMEIYNEAVKDLLSSDHTPLRLLDDHERGTVVDKLTEETVTDWSHLKELLSVCEAQRQIGETSLNETSSRSHQIIRLTIESCAREFLGKEDASTLSATVNFVDLAGSERASQTMSAGARLKEGCHINRSLLTLGTVIRKLSKGGSGHIPYRDSKLTRILQHSLGGNARTAIICTMSPAKSYVEQTRNTLLFASCAKQVSTSAQVNVVMSDKALVKHLQKELSRLEVELKCTKSPSNISQADALLMEKENHIRELEEKLQEFMHQRDLAQSRLQDVLRSTGNNQFSAHPDIRKPPRSRTSNGQSQPISPTTYDGPEYGVTNFSTSSDIASESDISSNHDLQILWKQTDEEVPSARFPSITGQYFDELLKQHGGEDITMVNSDEFGNLWKEVRCIEINETSTSKETTSVNFSMDENSESNSVELRSTDYEDQKIQNENKAAGDNLMKQHKYELQQSPNQLSEVSCNSSSISRSMSFRSSVTRDSSSRWYSDNEDISTTPSIRRLFKDFPGQLQYESQSSRAEAISAPEDDIASLCEFVVGLREIARVKYQKQHVGGQTQSRKAERKLFVDTTILIPPKNTSADQLMVNHVESPLQWPLEFEKRQRRIIVLWHECNVSLVHRTYFFLLFKGDPSDSFYMEVELRRLSFLKRVFTLGDAYKPVMEDGCIVTPASSKKALRREREMLSKKMLKTLSSGERKSIYLKWGIPLDSKKRRLQLAELLWSDTRNMTSIRDSASIVAKLIGLLEPGQALKEMFGLSFTPQKMSRRSSWKDAMPSPIRSAYSC